MKIGVVADDITGANDIGLAFKNGGAEAVIYTYNENLKIQSGITDRDINIAIIDTDSRFDSYEKSYEKAYNATKTLLNWGADKLFNKTCSVFRGNIGAEFDAMQDASGINKSMVVLGFPKNGRTTIRGIHYVYGTPLEHTQFANDPIHPMDKSRLTDILKNQTKRSVSHISCDLYDSDQSKNHTIAGTNYISSALLRQKIENIDSNYIIFDVRNDDDLKFLAEVLKEEKMYCGSSALAEFLPKSLGIDSNLTQTPKEVDTSKGILISAGSLTPQTIEQIEFGREYMKVYKIDTVKLIRQTASRESDVGAYKYKQYFVRALSSEINSNKNVIIHTANSPKEVLSTKNVAKQYGFDDKETGQIISSFLASICKEVLDMTGTNRFITLGGDTSAAISSKLGIRTMYVGQEIVPGVPTLSSDTIPPYYFVLKSGSFGEKDFIVKAIEKLE